jgi:hypothetical protein
MKYPIIALTVLTAAAQAAPEEPRKDIGILVYAVGGTGGIGAGIGYHFNDFLSLRGEIANYTYDDTVSESGIEWEGNLELATQGLFLDIKPFAGSFRLTAGFNASNHSLAKLTARGTGAAIDLGGSAVEVDPGESVSGSVDYDTRPYLGIGWGLARDGFTVALDLGVEIGKPNISVTATTIPGGALEDALDLDSGLLDREAAELRSDLDQLKLYPIIKLSVGYSF